MNTEKETSQDRGGGGSLLKTQENYRWIEAPSGRGRGGGGELREDDRGGHSGGVSTLGGGAVQSEDMAGWQAGAWGTLVVDEVPRINKRLLRGHLEGTEGTVAIRVRDNVKYMAGMAAQGYQEAPGIWVIPGKGPRYRGRW